jgi:hypothetical protein
MQKTARNTKKGSRAYTITGKLPHQTKYPVLNNARFSQRTYAGKFGRIDGVRNG